MRAQSQQGLEALAESDPISRPLALLHVAALQAASEGNWDDAVATLATDLPVPPTPALHKRSIPISIHETTQLINQLVRTLERAGSTEPGLAKLKVTDESAISLIKAVIEWDIESLSHIADEAGADPAVIAIIGQSATMPVLLAVGRRLMPGLTDFPWQEGYCPICGSWPLLSELRGLERQQWLRCGRCCAAWQSRHQRCVYCDNTDHQKLGYMAPEAERESRRVITCDDCSGYLKAFATVSPYGIEDILRQDLASIELDVAAIDAGYSRPERPGFPIEVELVPYEAPRSQRNGRWLPWS
jgi:FdhE protein